MIVIKKLSIIGISDQDIKLENCDLKDYSDLFRIYKKHQPCKIFNLAAQSSVFNSFQHPLGTIDFNINSVLNHIEIIRNFYPDVYLYQATSSECLETSRCCQSMKTTPLTGTVK